MLHFKISSILGLPFAPLNGVFVGALREHRVHQEDIWDLCHVTGQTGIRRRTCWNTRGFLMFYLNISHQKSLLLKMIFQFQGRIWFFFCGGISLLFITFGGGIHLFPLVLVFFLCKTKSNFKSSSDHVVFVAPDVWKPRTAFSCPDSSCFCRFRKNAVVGH